MPRKKTETAKQNGNSAKLGFEEKLWQAADKQRGHMEAAEYKHVFFGANVDYLGIADQLKEALKNYTECDRGETGIPTEVALALMQEKYEVVKAMYHGFDYEKFFTGTPGERLSLIPAAMNHILELTDGKERYVKAVTELSKAFALVSSLDEAIAIRPD